MIGYLHKIAAKVVKIGRSSKRFANFLSLLP